MGSRYFFINFLPPLSLDTTPEMSLDEVEFFMHQNLSSSEMRVVNRLYTFFDLENIRSFLLDLPMKVQGTIPHDALRDMLENDECPLPALEKFFTCYPTLEERKSHVHDLLSSFFQGQPHSLPRFVAQYFRIENTSRSLMAYLRAQALGKTYEINAEDLGFDPADNKSWPEIFSPLFTLWQARRQSPLDLEQAYASWKFDVIDSLTAQSAPFSLDLGLAYLLQLHLIESRRELKKPAQQNILERIAKAVQ